MKFLQAYVALSATVLPSIVFARLDPQELGLLTMVTNYTFHSICNDFNNPDLFFDEAVPQPIPTPSYLQRILKHRKF